MDQDRPSKYVVGQRYGATAYYDSSSNLIAIVLHGEGEFMVLISDGAVEYEVGKALFTGDGFTFETQPGALRQPTGYQPIAEIRGRTIRPLGNTRTPLAGNLPTGEYYPPEKSLNRNPRLDWIKEILDNPPSAHHITMSETPYPGSEGIWSKSWQYGRPQTGRDINYFDREDIIPMTASDDPRYQIIPTTDADGDGVDDEAAERERLAKIIRHRPEDEDDERPDGHYEETQTSG